MKKLRTILFFAFMIATGTIGVLSSTISWFDSRVKFDANNITGNVLGKYFAYGTGTKDDPYGITHAIHLYNLSWLQYMGYFEQGDGEPDTLYYFELGNDINANETYDALKVLPPIGTEDNPFIGQLNGNGHTISNFTFANAVNTPLEVGITRIPDRVTDYVPDSNVGIFGKVASLGSDVDGDNTLIKDIGFSNITVKSTGATTAGIVAGSLDGVTQNVAVQSPTLDIVSGSTASEYTLVGACDDKYTHDVKKVNTDVYDLEVKNLEFTAEDNGLTQGYGGSVDFKQVHSRLNYVRRELAATAPDANGERYPRHRAIVYNPNGSTYSDSWVSQVQTESQIQNYYDGSGGTTGTERHYAGGSYDPQYGAYQFGFANGTPDDKDNVWIHYLAGGHYTQEEYRENNSYSGCTISDGSNFLCINANGELYNGNSGNGISEANATVWSMPSNGSTGKIYARLADGGEQYFLEGTAGTLTVNAGSGTTNWYISENATTRTYRTSNNYYLYFSDTWYLSSIVPGNADEYYLIYDSNGHYMMEPTNRLVLSTTSRANAAKWVLSSESNKTFALQSNANKVLSYYYRSRIFSSSTTYTVQAYATDSYTTEYRFTGTLPGRNATASGKFRRGTSNNYILYQNNASEPWTANGTGSTFTVEHYYRMLQTTTQKTTSKDFPYVAINESRTTGGMDYSGQDVTYFPLNVNGTNTKGLDPYKPTDGNSGYIVGGSNYASINGESYSSTVRISAYDIDSGYESSNAILSSVYSNGEIKKVYTVDDDAIDVDITNSAAYQKYADSKEKLEGVLNNEVDSIGYDTNYTYSFGDSKSYALHFMDNIISKDNLVTASYARIDGADKTNYEMPASSIDFSLKDKGYINFFAGTYYRTKKNGISDWYDVDGFFSLYSVFRYQSGANQGRIAAIRRITKIWFDDSDTTKNKAHSYVYEYEPELDARGETVTYCSVPYRLSPDSTRYLLDEDGGDTSQVEWTKDSIVPIDDKQSTYTHKVFDTKWIETPHDGSAGYVKRSIYYFEIPMSPGEYCLGSVEGSESGAYLMYLDIGANAQTVDRTTIIQKIVSTTKNFKYVEGIFVVENAKNAASSLFDITYGPSSEEVSRVRNSTDIDSKGAIAIDLDTGYTDTISLTRSGETMTISRAGPPAKMAVQYANPDLSVKIGEDAVTPVGLSSSEKTQIVVDYYDINTNNMSLTHTVLTYDGSNTPTDVKQYLNGSETPVASGNETMFNDKGELLDSDSIEALAAPSNQMATKCIEFEYYCMDNEDVELVSKLASTINGFYYKASSYTFTFSQNGQSFVVTVNNVNGSIRAIINRGADQTSVAWECTYTIVIDGVSYVVSTAGDIPPQGS